MDGYTIGLDLVPNDNYQRALNDCKKAYDSFQKLTQQQKEQLVKEIVGYDGFVKFCMMMNRGL